MAVAAAFLASEHTRMLIVLGLSLLAITGLVSLFGFALGFFTLSGRGQRNDLTKAIADSSPEATLVVDAQGRILYANEAYARLCGATSYSTLVPVERLFTGSAEVSEGVYRLAQAARDGKIADEEMRVAVPARPMARRHGTASVSGRWRARAVTRRCGRCRTSRATGSATRISSRPCKPRLIISTRAGRIPVDRAGRAHCPYQRHAGGLARL